MINTTRTIIVGDVHGCIDELHDLMSIIAPNTQDHIIFCGDLVDKGPDAAAVVRYVHELAICNHVTLIEGNHENKHRRWRHHEYSNLGKNPIKLRDHDAILSKTLSIEDIDFLDSAVLFHHIKELDIIVMHGGILPGMLQLPTSNRQSDMSHSAWKYFKQMMYVRYVRDNNMVMLGTERPDDIFWTDLYDGRFGTAYYGHQPRLIDEPHISKHAVGLDLGCCFGGRLMAAVLTQSDRQFISVPARRAYADINRYAE